MTHIQGANNYHVIRHADDLPTSIAGTGYAFWDNVNLSSLTFDITRPTVGYGSAFNIWLGEGLTPVPAPVPEPSSLLLMAGGMFLFRRNRKKN